MPQCAADSLPSLDYECPVHDWIENFGRYTDSISRLIGEVGVRFKDCGLPLTRLSVIVRTLHPQIAVTGYTWNGDTGEMEEFKGDHQSQSSNPISAALSGRYSKAPSAFATAFSTRTVRAIFRSLRNSMNRESRTT